MCGEESLLVFHYFLGSFLHVIIPYSFSFYHLMCVVLRKLVCVKWEKKIVLCEDNIYDRFWLEVVSDFSFVFSFDFLND
jgi:hypothetical protein